MAISYEYEKTGAAVSALVGAEPIQKRLHYAWTGMHQLFLHGIKDPERQAEYTRINDLLSLDMNGERISVEAVTANLSEEAAEKIAVAIVSLHNALMHEHIYALEDELRDLKRKG